MEKKKNKDKNKTNSKSNIKCDVNSCNYNDTEEGKCILDEVSISCDCNRDSCCDSSTTLCESFESSGSPITDNEYEVVSEDEFEINNDEEKEAMIM